MKSVQITIQATRESLAMLLTARILRADQLVAAGVAGEELNAAIECALQRAGEDIPRYWNEFAAVLEASGSAVISDTTHVVGGNPAAAEAPPSVQTRVEPHLFKPDTPTPRVPDLDDQAKAWVESLLPDLDRVTRWARQTEKQVTGKARKQIRDDLNIRPQLSLTAMEPEQLESYASALALHLLLHGKVLHVLAEEPEASSR